MGETEALVVDPQLKEGDFSQHLIDEANGTEPAAEGAAHEDSEERDEKPGAEEIRCQSSPTGNDWTVAAVDERDEEGTSKDAIESPFAEDAEHDELDEMADFW